MRPVTMLRQDPTAFWEIWDEYVLKMTLSECAAFLRIPEKDVRERRLELRERNTNRGDHQELYFTLPEGCRWEGSPKAEYRAVLRGPSKDLLAVQHRRDPTGDWVDMESGKVALAVMLETPLGEWVVKEVPVAVADIQATRPDQPAVYPLQT